MANQPEPDDTGGNGGYLVFLLRYAIAPASDLISAEGFQQFFRDVFGSGGLAQVDALLAQCGSDKTKLVDATIYLADMADYAAMNQAWDSWVAPGCAPARATVEAKLADPAWKVEIKIVAAQ